MDQLGVVTSVLVISTLLTSMEDIRRFFRRRAGQPEPELPAPSTDAPAEPARTSSGDLMTALLSDLESDDGRRVGRGLSMIDKVPAAAIAPRLIQMLRHPRDEVSARAAKALMQLNTPESLEPLYLYFSARGNRIDAA